MKTEPQDLVKRINDREDQIANLYGLTIVAGNRTIDKVIDQGLDLIAAREQRRHGEWLPWLKANCPKVSDRKARRYISVALNRERLAELPENAGSLKMALALLGMEGVEPKTEAPKQWPPWLEAQGKLSKFVGYVERFDIHGWPQEGIDKLRADLLPLVQKLWPDFH